MPFFMGSKKSTPTAEAEETDTPTPTTQDNDEVLKANGHAKLKKAEPPASVTSSPSKQHQQQVSLTRRFLRSLRSRDSPPLRYQNDSSASSPPPPPASIPQQPSPSSAAPVDMAGTEDTHSFFELGHDSQKWKQQKDQCLKAFGDKHVEFHAKQLYDDSVKVRHSLAREEDRLFNPTMVISPTGWTEADVKKEEKAAAVLEAMKALDKRDISKLPPLTGYNGQKHPRFVGDHFLTNVDWISKKSRVFKVAQQMPKGAHLHVHFNACLPENFLLDLAMQKEQLKYMYIRSKVPLVSPESFLDREIQFQMMPDDNDLVREYTDLRAKLDSCNDKLRHATGPNDRMRLERELGELKKRDNYIWGTEYNKNPSKSGFPPYKFEHFLNEFAEMYQAAHGGAEYQLENKAPDNMPDSWQKAREWLLKKLVFEEEEAHNSCQTIMGVWENFDCRTRMMKGLFSYETAYKRYIDALLQHFVDDKIQYAEIRPNFMQTNQLFRVLEGGKQAMMDNYGIMDLIVTKFEEFQRRNKSPLLGLKVIYCVPRSFPNDLVKWGLEECIIFKKIWPQYIAAFDLIGPEFRGRPLKDFAEQFGQFRARCQNLDITIPFAFHCGETYEWGGDTDGNLFDAVCMGDSVRRIGHGGGLINHPKVLKLFRERNMCVEVCPISNEQLGLTPRIGSHPVYALLANGIHCAVSGDNGTLFRSTLSHDMYQIQIGQPKMRLQAWRQLAEWSLEHSILSDEERKAVIPKWRDLWRQFLGVILVEGAKTIERDEMEKGKHN